MHAKYMYRLIYRKRTWVRILNQSSCHQRFVPRNGKVDRLDPKWELVLTLIFLNSSRPSIDSVSTDMISSTSLLSFSSSEL